MSFHCLRPLVIVAATLGATAAFAAPIATLPCMPDAPGFGSWGGVLPGDPLGGPQTGLTGFNDPHDGPPNPGKPTGNGYNFCPPTPPAGCGPTGSGPKTCVPEPCSIAILGMGVAGFLARRKKNS